MAKKPIKQPPKGRNWHFNEELESVFGEDRARVAAENRTRRRKK